MGVRKRVSCPHCHSSWTFYYPDNSSEGYTPGEEWAESQKQSEYERHLKQCPEMKNKQKNGIN